MDFSTVHWDGEADRQLFLEEAQELLATLEDGALSEAPQIDALFRAAHTLKGSAGMIGLESWVAVTHQLEEALDRVRHGARGWDRALREQTLATVDRLRRDVAASEMPRAAAQERCWLLRWSPACPMPGVRTYQVWQAVQAIAPAATVEPGIDELPTWSGRESVLKVPADVGDDRIRELLEGFEELESADIAPNRPDTAVAAQDAKPAAVPTPPSRDHTVRIGVDTLERILEGIGELLLDHAQLEHHLGSSIDHATRSVLAHLRSRALDLQETTLRARMLPLNTLFRQYPRAVHDLAQKLDKTIQLEAVGGETELDRVVMDSLHEPLLHLLRNACDHGIEAPEVRRSVGKSEAGRIRLEAYAAEGHVNILVSDDGAGIDWSRLRAKAIREGWLTPEEANRASDGQLTDLLFRPGISTADQVTEVSGRGVGLDAVQDFLDSIHGTITVESHPGEGTTFHLELPMTIAIFTALLVEAGSWIIGIPIAAVEGIDDAREHRAESALGIDVLQDGNGPLPAYALARLLHPDVPAPPGSYWVRVRDGRTRAALGVDRVRGQQEVVIKPVDAAAVATPWMSGVALLGDGQLALIADVRRLVPYQAAEIRGGEEPAMLRAGSNEMEVLVFRLTDGQRYGINIYKTREVILMPPITTVQSQHPWVGGFVQLRGQTVPVIDLCAALDLPRATSPHLLLVTEFNQAVQAFPLDGVEQMVRVSWTAVEPLQSLLNGGGQRPGRLTGFINHEVLGPIQLIDFEQIVAEVAPPEYPHDVLAAAPGLRGASVWLADDSSVARRQVEKALGPLGVAVRSFADGEALWTALTEETAPPHLLVLDVEMPKLDGYALARRVKSDRRTAAIPVLLHTSLSGHWHAERAATVSADAFITKFNPEELARAVSDLLTGASVQKESGEVLL